VLLSEIILQTSHAALQLQQGDGSFPGGHNGPYHDYETPVRNTAHWLITILKAFEISDEPDFIDSALRAVQYLLSPSARPMGATFFCRTNPEKDFCNGVMGQAWVIEALAIAGMKLNDPRCIEVAQNVFMLHPFDREAGLWRRVNVDGSYNSFDMTFNHQLWFAASGAMLDNDLINSEISLFIDHAMEYNLSLDPSGRIIHGISRPFAKNNKRHALMSFFRRPKHANIENTQATQKEIGYHAFNMYAFSMLKQRMPELPFWQSSKFLSALGFINNEEFIAGLENNIYGYPYNPPGFEVALTIQEFSTYLSFSKSREWWVEQQLRRCYDTEKKMLSRSTEDEKTLSARFYEATRLKDMEAEIT
jgi:hypothetical protein